MGACLKRFQVKWVPAHRPERRQHKAMEPGFDFIKIPTAPGFGAAVAALGMSLALTAPTCAQTAVQTTSKDAVREAAHTPDPTASQTTPPQMPSAAAPPVSAPSVAVGLRPGIDPEPKSPEASQAALNAIEGSITISKKRAATLRHEIEAMTGDRAKQNAALIAAGQRVKIAEIEVGSMEERLTNLTKAETEVRTRLDGTNVGISNMLAALERISLNPPPALIVNPSDALGSARGAMLISAIVPQLRAKAASVSADLKRLAKIKADAQSEQDQLKANYSVLEEEQLRIATLIQARKQGVAVVSAQLDAQEKEAEALGAKATSLKQLVVELTAKVKAVSAAASEAAAADAANTKTPLPATIKLALANTARTAPAMPFSAARGYLAMPAAGTDIMDFGNGDGFGGIAEGTTLETRAGAQVVAPADGWVIYKGPYLNYGQIVILNPGDGYTIVLAGLDTVSVDLGQFVLMGEPLGVMGSRTIGHTTTASTGVSRPTLYIEFRNNDKPIDPTGWWAPQSKTQSG